MPALAQVLQQLHLLLRGAWALTSLGFPWAGQGDLTTHHALPVISMLRVPQQSVGPNRVPQAASLPWELRDNIPRHSQPRDPLGTTGCERANGATRPFTTPKARLAVLTQQGLRAGSTWEPHSAPGPWPC